MGAYLHLLCRAGGRTLVGTREDRDGRTHLGASGRGDGRTLLGTLPASAPEPVGARGWCPRFRFEILNFKWTRIGNFVSDLLYESSFVLCGSLVSSRIDIHSTTEKCSEKRKKDMWHASHEIRKNPASYGETRL